MTTSEERYAEARQFLKDTPKRITERIKASGGTAPKGYSRIGGVAYNPTTGRTVASEAAEKVAQKQAAQAQLKTQQVVAQAAQRQSIVRASAVSKMQTQQQVRDLQQTTTTPKIKAFREQNRQFFLTEPTLKGIGKKKGFRQGAELVKYTFFKPAAAFGTAITDVGSFIKKSGKPTSKVVGTAVGGVGTLIPKTPAGQIALVGGVKIYGALPKVARIGASSYFTYSGTRTAADPSFTPEERVAGGIVAGLGATGAAFETIPYIRGAAARISPRYKPVRTQPEGFKAIEIAKQERIGLIKPGSPAKTGATKVVELPKVSPLKRGGFGVKSSEKEIFLGEPQTVTTSQVGLFKPGKEVPFDREFFTTPQEPFLKIPETRISRLAIEELFKAPKVTEFGFGIPGKPQIGLERAAKVSRLETGRAYRIGTGSELEAIKSKGVITDIKKIGVTTVEGYGVDIYEFKTGTVKGITPSISELKTTAPTARVSGEAAVSISTGIPRYTRATTLKTGTISIPTITTLSRTIGAKTTVSVSPRTAPTATPTYKSPRKIETKPLSIPTYPKVSQKIPTKTVPTIPYYPRTLPKIPKAPQSYPFLKGKPAKLPRQPKKFTVFGRRFGVFKLVGTAKTERTAFSLGKKWARTNLGATFKIPKAKARKLPGFRTKYEKGEVFYIEPKGKRLKRGSGEIPEIKFYKSIKGGKK